jgi:hypothetical protein
MSGDRRRAITVVDDIGRKEAAARERNGATSFTRRSRIQGIRSV